MGLAARMLSSELEMYPMIAVAHEIAMVRTAGSICMARSAPGSLARRGASRRAGRARGKLLEGASGQMVPVGDKARKYCMPPAELEICSR